MELQKNAATLEISQKHEQEIEDEDCCQCDLENQITEDKDKDRVLGESQEMQEKSLGLQSQMRDNEAQVGDNVAQVGDNEAQVGDNEAQATTAADKEGWSEEFTGQREGGEPSDIEVGGDYAGGTEVKVDTFGGSLIDQELVIPKLKTLSLKFDEDHMSPKSEESGNAVGQGGEEVEAHGCSLKGKGPYYQEAPGGEGMRCHNTGGSSGGRPEHVSYAEVEEIQARYEKKLAVAQSEMKVLRKMLGQCLYEAASWRAWAEVWSKINGREWSLLEEKEKAAREELLRLREEYKREIKERQRIQKDMEAVCRAAGIPWGHHAACEERKKEKHAYPKWKVRRAAAQQILHQSGSEYYQKCDSTRSHPRQTAMWKQLPIPECSSEDEEQYLPSHFKANVETGSARPHPAPHHRDLPRITNFKSSPRHYPRGDRQALQLEVLDESNRNESYRHRVLDLAFIPQEPAAATGTSQRGPRGSRNVRESEPRTQNHDQGTPSSSLLEEYHQEAMGSDAIAGPVGENLSKIETNRLRVWVGEGHPGDGSDGHWMSWCDYARWKHTSAVKVKVLAKKHATSSAFEI